LSSHSILVVGKHLQTSAEILNDKTNLEVVCKTIKAYAHSSSVSRTVKELIEMEESNYESLKDELERLKKDFQCFIKQFDPIKEPQNGTDAEYCSSLKRLYLLKALSRNDRN